MTRRKFLEASAACVALLWIGVPAGRQRAGVAEVPNSPSPEKGVPFQIQFEITSTRGVVVFP